MTPPNQIVAATLARLADEHLRSMAEVPWAAYAKAIRERAAVGRPAGDTFGCVVEGRYYDIGDSESWLNDDGGDIRLVAYAVTYDADDEVEAEATNERIIRQT